MIDDAYIEELLNGFIDGELTARQQTEVQRLISHDRQIAQRLRQLEKCKILVGSLPHVDAPAETFAQVKASLGAKAVQDPEVQVQPTHLH